MSGAYRGEAKTDARDAYVIAETVRHCGDLQEVEVPTALVTGLRLLVAHRTDLVTDRVRMVNRLRECSAATSQRWSVRSTTPIVVVP
jgi:transposase